MTQPQEQQIPRPTHPELVHRLTKPGLHILQTLTPLKVEYIHMALGITTEAGELGDAIKAHAIYGKELDRANIIEELGDLEFFMERLRDLMDISREETLEANIDKLQTRYAKGYSDAAAQARVDKQ